jgi:hypothetical protein
MNNEDVSSFRTNECPLCLSTWLTKQAKPLNKGWQWQIGNVPVHASSTFSSFSCPSFAHLTAKACARIRPAHLRCFIPQFNILYFHLVPTRNHVSCHSTSSIILLSFLQVPVHKATYEYSSSSISSSTSLLLIDASRESRFSGVGKIQDYLFLLSKESDITATRWISSHLS